MKPEYENPQFPAPADVARILATGTERELCNLAVGTANSGLNLQQEYAILEQLLTNESVNVKATALTGLGHLARMHGDIPMQPTVNILLDFLTHDDAKLRGAAKSVSSDLRIFAPSVGREITGRYSAKLRLQRKENKTR